MIKQKARARLCKRARATLIQSQGSSLLLALRQEPVQHQRTNPPVATPDSSTLRIAMRHVRRELWHLRHTQAQCQRHGNNQQRPTVQPGAGQNIDPRRRNRTKHDHRRAAQHRLRHGLNHPGNTREQTQQHQHHGNPHTDMTAGNTGQLNHPVVLGKNRAREGVEQTGQQRVGAVDQHAPLIRCIHIGPSTGWRDTLLVAVTSPMASSEVTR